MKLPGCVSASAIDSGCGRCASAATISRIITSSSTTSARAPGSVTAVSRKRRAPCSTTSSVVRSGLSCRGIGETGAGQRQRMETRQRVGHRAEFDRQARRATLDEVDDQRPAGQAGPRLDHFMQARRAPRRRKMPEGLGLQMKSRRCRRIVFVGIGDPREATVPQPHMTMRRARRRQRLALSEGREDVSHDSPRPEEGAKRPSRRVGTSTMCVAHPSRRAPPARS